MKTIILNSFICLFGYGCHCSGDCSQIDYDMNTKQGENIKKIKLNDCSDAKYFEGDTLSYTDSLGHHHQVYWVCNLAK